MGDDERQSDKDLERVDRSIEEAREQAEEVTQDAPSAGGPIVDRDEEPGPRAT